jgi:signal transduction histidine kinase/CHASE3 domain sensor protein
MSKKTIYTFFAAFILLVAVIVVDRLAFYKMQQFSLQVDHTREVITSFEQLAHHFKSLQVYSKKYAAMGERDFYSAYAEESAEVKPDLERLRHLTADNPEQQRRIDTINAYVAKMYDTLYAYNIAELILMGKGDKLKGIFEIHATINRGVDKENQLLNSRKEELNTSTNITRVFSLIFSILAAILIAATFISNVTLRRKGHWLEGLLETILNTSQDGIVYYRANRKKSHGDITGFIILYANPAVKELLAKTKAKDKARVPELESFIKDAGLFEQFKNVVVSGKPAEMEILYEKNNNRKWLNIMLARMEDGITVTLHDITSLKDYQEDLTEKISQLQRSNAELEQYAYAASHDLQEPLRKIILYADVLQSGASGLSPKQQDTLARIQRASERMTVLIKDLLAYSSLNTRHEIAPVDLNMVLKSVLEDVEAMIEQKNASIMKETLPVVEGIAAQFSQLFYNLIHNALKFSAAGRQPVINIGPREVSAGEQQRFHISQPKDWVVIVVKDNGVGFNPQYAENIYGMFKRLHTRQQYEGSGIGLALVHKVVENHNGFIYTDSEIDKGATFNILLPLRRPPKD